jgi:hypothetical protein
MCIAAGDALLSAVFGRIDAPSMFFDFLSASIRSCMQRALCTGRFRKGLRVEKRVDTLAMRYLDAQPK